MPSPPPTSPGEPHCADPGPAGGAVLPLVPGFARRPAKKRPLPDAAAVRLLGVPDSAPPYDDSPAPPEAAARRRATPRRTPAARPERAKRAARDRPSSPSEPHLPRRRPAAAAAWPSQFAQVLAETLAGSRPPGQIRPWTSEQARRRIRQLGPRLATPVQPRVRRVMTSRPAAGVVEMTAIVGFGPRIRVLAVRLECDRPDPSGTRQDGPYRPPGPNRDPATTRWMCTAIEAA
jgi:hypothetical protein